MRRAMKASPFGKGKTWADREHRVSWMDAPEPETTAEKTPSLMQTLWARREEFGSPSQLEIEEALQVTGPHAAKAMKLLERRSKVQKQNINDILAAEVSPRRRDRSRDQQRRQVSITLSLH